MEPLNVFLMTPLLIYYVLPSGNSFDLIAQSMKNFQQSICSIPNKDLFKKCFKIEF